MPDFTAVAARVLIWLDYSPTLENRLKQVLPPLFFCLWTSRPPPMRGLLKGLGTCVDSTTRDWLWKLATNSSTAWSNHSSSTAVPSILNNIFSGTNDRVTAYRRSPAESTIPRPVCSNRSWRRATPKRSSTSMVDSSNGCMPRKGRLLAANSGPAFDTRVYTYLGHGPKPQGLSDDESRLTRACQLKSRRD